MRKKMRRETGTKTIKEMVDALIANRGKIRARQNEIMAALPKKEQNRYCRNRGCHGGWVTPGNGAWTQAVNRTPGFYSDNYWSGSAPTPSTQYELAVAEFLESFCEKGKNKGHHTKHIKKAQGKASQKH